MPSVDRRDEPGAWHHVTNRGIALELHAFAIRTTHFHFTVRSPIGALSPAIRRIEHDDVRWFNRRCRRDRPLCRGRFLSRRVDTHDAAEPRGRGARVA
jgi:hypothetical protein